MRDRVYVSAYPLALWFASEWWWLRWEPAPKGQDRATAWRMAHEMLAAGSGYLWPRLTFECDGERVCVTALRSDITASEPIGFIEAFKKWILVGDFESEID
ncbi:MAG: hypothetical protein EXQ96_06550 [Alphaproteobacteria bacterium]|nr:hypothetical protein [Alphaproteobacteria bacterium]